MKILILRLGKALTACCERCIKMTSNVVSFSTGLAAAPFDSMLLLNPSLGNKRGVLVFMVVCHKTTMTAVEVAPTMPISSVAIPASKLRAALYIDGFNFYHALDALQVSDHYCKWLDWKALAQKIVDPSYSIGRITLCTAPPKHKEDSVQDRHRNYMNALKSSGVIVKEGWFLPEGVKCRSCSSSWNRYTEKEGDVNLALSLIEDAYEDLFDIAFLVTSDTDQVPTLKLLKRKFDAISGRHKKVIMVFPSWRGENAASRNLANHASGSQKISVPMLKSSLLPKTITQTTAGGIRIIYRPPEYDPPS